MEEDIEISEEKDKIIEVDNGISIMNELPIEQQRLCAAILKEVQIDALYNLNTNLITRIGYSLVSA